MVAVIYTRGRAFKTAIAVVFVVVAAASLLTMAVQLVMSAFGVPNLISVGVSWLG